MYLNTTVGRQRALNEFKNYVDTNAQSWAKGSRKVRTRSDGMSMVRHLDQTGVVTVPHQLSMQAAEYYRDVLNKLINGKA